MVCTGVEYYSAVKRKDILILAVAWMNLEDVMLSEISQIQRKNTI